MKTHLSLRGIRLQLGDFRLQADVEIGGGCTGLFGPSGSGKTTLIELIAGLRRTTVGRIELDGRVLSDPADRTWIPPHLRRIGYVPQDLALFPHLNVRANVLYGARALSPAEQRASLEALGSLFELEPLLDRRLQGLSGGERQRVAIARALAARPALLLLDEPLTGLDQDRRDHVIAYLRRPARQQSDSHAVCQSSAGRVGRALRRRPGAGTRPHHKPRRTARNLRVGSTAQCFDDGP